MEEALVAMLLGNQPLTALVGDRIHFITRPTPDLPAISLQVINANTEYTHGGRSDLVYARVQADVWGKSYGSAKRVSRLYCAAMEQGDDRAEAIFFEAIEVNNSDRDTETLPGGTKVFRVLVEHMVPYKLKEA